MSNRINVFELLCYIVMTNVTTFFTLLWFSGFFSTTTTTMYTHYIHTYVFNALPIRILKLFLNTPLNLIRILYVENRKATCILYVENRSSYGR